MIAQGPGIVRVRRGLSTLNTVADDAGALLVRSGLVSSNALDDARARVASIGGTLGEQLVTTGAIGDDDLTDFYRARLLVPQVNPNMLARLTPKVVETIPGDMAIELRAIPVSLDGENNLTVAMSDPSDRHAVDEIAFFTGAYVVRAVATQMQIAWCLAHYYGHVTALGQRLLSVADSDAESPTKAASSGRLPRTKGLTGKVNATRHRAIAPITGPVNVARPNSDELDIRPFATAGDPVSEAAGAPRGTSAKPTAGAKPVAAGTTGANAKAKKPAAAAPATAAKPAASGSPAAAPQPATIAPPTQTSTTAPATPDRVASAAPAGAAKPGPRKPRPAPSLDSSPSGDPASAAGAARSTLPGTLAPFPFSADRSARPSLPTDDVDHAPAPTDEPPEPVTTDDGVPDKPRARSLSGEIRVPGRRAPSIRPPMPTPEPEEDDEPLIVIEQGAILDDDTGPPRKLAPRRRVVKTDPPELYARAGEVDLRADSDHEIDADEPRIVIDQDALATSSLHEATTGSFERPTLARRLAPLRPSELHDDLESGAAIHDHMIERDSQPILLDRPRGTPEQFSLTSPAPVHDDGEGYDDEDDEDTGETDIVVLAARKLRPERHTQVGTPPAPRSRHDTDANGIAAVHAHRAHHDDRAPDHLDGPTALDIAVAPAGDDPGSDVLAVPPAPSSYADTNPYVIASPPAPGNAARRSAALSDDDDDDDDSADDAPGAHDRVMSPAALAALPPRRHINHDSVDDGWGPPGTTIPPPLLGAIPGSEDDDERNVIPMASVDSSPLMVGPPSLPSRSAAVDLGSRAMVRALEDATARAIDLIRLLEHAQSRDQVVNVMIAHLAETHHRAGFLVTRHASSKGPAELGLFTMTPKPAVTPYATLRLDRASTLQDIIGTRLPYRGPMHDETSRTFLIAILGACPPEILLVPVAVRERVVGLLFAEHRQRHTFDDQLALAARAAGMALERILKAKRG